MTVHPIMKQLRVRRCSLGMTQAQLAARSGYAHTAICQWERGQRKIFLHTLNDLAGALGLTLKLDRVG